MDKLEAFKTRMRAVAQYYPRDYDVSYGWNADKRTWQHATVKCDTCYKAELEAILKEVGGHIYRENGFFY